MLNGENRSRSRVLTAASVVDRPKAIFAHEGKDAEATGAVRHTERRTVAGWGRVMLVEPPLHDIPNVLQEAVEEDTYEKKLTQVCFAFGLLMGALNSPPHK